MTAHATPVRTITEGSQTGAPAGAPGRALDLTAAVIAFLGLLVLLSSVARVGLPIGTASHVLAVAMTLAGLAIVAGAKRVEPDERRAWGLIGAGVTIAGFGQAFKALVGPAFAAIQQVPDLFSIGAVLVLSVGLVRLPHVRSTRIGTVRVAIDVLVAMTAASAVLWDLQPGVLDDGPGAPALHAMMLAALFVAFLRRSPYVHDVRLGVLTAALVAFVTTVDLGPFVGPASNLSRRALAVVLLACVAWLLGRPQPRRSMVLARPGKKQLVVPGVPLVALGLVLAARVTGGGELAGTVLPWAILVVSFALAARSAVAVVENRQLMALERDQLLASLSRELRTPLTAVAGFSHVLTGAWDDIAEQERREIVGVIGDEADSLVDIVSDLNALARSELDTADLELERVEGKALIADAIRVVFDLDRPLPIKAEVEPYVELICDRRRMVQVLRALFDNALRYGNGRILVVARRTRSGRILEVHDDGVGVEPRYEKVIWKRFERGAHELNANVPGSGLGLSVVRAIARAHQGEATYRRSEKLGGACFAVELPYHKDLRID